MKFEWLKRVVPLALATIFAFVPTLAAHAQTADQLRVFQSLPKEQRDALLQQMGVGGGAASRAPRVGGQNQIIVQQPADASTRERAEDATFPAEERRIRGGEQLLIEISLRPEGKTQTITEITPDGREVVRRQTTDSGQGLRTPDDQRRLTELRARILRRNPYELTSRGALELPGLPPIGLLGLTEREVQERLTSDPALRDFLVNVTVLRIEAQGTRALKPFGYDMFRGTATAFVPGTDIPAPDDYRLGPGDVLDVQLYGQQSKTYSLPVERDGSISFPDLGPMSLGGLDFGKARAMLEGRVRQQMIGTQARVTLSELRSVRVLVLGDAEQPGSYVVSGLSTVTNALFASGGVKPIGSLRTIEVKRDGRLLRRLDLYSVLLAGDTSDDIRLQSGDAVFIPPVGPMVSIDGEVKRPAIYELAGERSAADVVALAGGLTPDADARRVTVERITDNGQRTVLMLDLASDSGRVFKLRSGDVLRIVPIRPVLDNAISIGGHVHRPGTYAWHPGMRISELVASIDELRPDADLRYVLVRRESTATREVSVFSVDLAAALARQGGGDDIELQSRDRVVVFDRTSPRDSVIGPLLDELARQGSPNAPSALVTVGGRVNAPGRYPLEGNMRVSDLVRAGGGLDDAAFQQSAELTRYYIVNGERRRAELVNIDLSAALAGDLAANVELRPYDVLSVKEMPEWGRVEQVELVGEVRFPGKYQIRRGETLRSVIDRAGGLSPLAFAPGAVFTREDLRVREREQLDRLAARLQSDISALALQSSQASLTGGQALTAGQGLLEQLRQTQPVGRLVIDLDGILRAGSGDADVVLRGGDRVLVPRLAQEVSVLGEVQNPTSHLYRPGMSRDDVVALSGGTTARADRKRTYVVRADGSVIANSSRWFSGGNVDVRPGDTVVVPLDAEKMRPLPLWTAVTTIIYNLAVAAAAVGSL